MQSPIWTVLGSIVAAGDLTLIDAAGRAHRMGDGSGEPVHVRFKDRRLEWAMITNPHLALGEGYMQGRLTVERGSLYDFLAVLASNVHKKRLPRWMRFFSEARNATRRFQNYNPLSRAKRNVAHHYDIGNDFYRLFLDSDWQYSCGYFTHEKATIEEAQAAKKQLIAAKLAIKPGQQVLDIGCGWGGLALHLAEHCGAAVKGITLSEEQAALAQQRAKERRLEAHVRFQIEDYRNVQERFDRIVSVGMFEHVGVPHYPAFFAMIERCLKQDGVALLHSIGRFEPPGLCTNPFVAKYIFPGGYIPSLSEVIPAIERAGLLISDIHILRLHYAKTLRAWRERFMSHRRQAVEMFSEEFCRMWEYYLTGAEIAFRHQGMMVFQLQMTKNIAALPITPNYIWQNLKPSQTVRKVA